MIALEEIRLARERLGDAVLRTPLVEVDDGIRAKLECLQPIGSFKLRSALNAIRAAPADALRHGVVTVSAGNLGEEILACSRGERRNDARPPFFVRNPDGTRGILRRQCTQDYKVDPIRRKVRELIGLRKGQRGPKETAVRQFIGISLDEAVRMKDSGNTYVRNEWPLIGQRLSRHDCVQWLEAKGYPEPPKSACTFCPYRRDHEWRRMRDRDPEAFEQACQTDEAIRLPGYCGLVGESYVHDSLKPLRDVDLSTAEDRGQLDWINGMSNECEGMCGV